MSTKIQTQDLDGGAASPWNNKYYGTEWAWVKWFQDLATVLAALWYTAWSEVSDAAYWAGWNGVTTIAPSKNSVYDYLESLFPGWVVPVAWAPIAWSTFVGYTNTATISTNGGVETTYATKTSNITGTVTASFSNFSGWCTLRIRKNWTQVLISGGLGSVTGAVAVVPGDVITFTAQIPGPEWTQPGTVKSITFSLDYTGTFS